MNTYLLQVSYLVKEYNTFSHRVTMLLTITRVVYFTTRCSGLLLIMSYFHLRWVLEILTFPLHWKCNFPLLSLTFPYKFHILLYPILLWKIGYIVMLRARMFRSLIIRTGIKERNIRARNITIQPENSHHIKYGSFHANRNITWIY